MTNLSDALRFCHQCEGKGLVPDPDVAARLDPPGLASQRGRCATDKVKPILKMKPILTEDSFGKNCLTCHGVGRLLIAPQRPRVKKLKALRNKAMLPWDALWKREEKWSNYKDSQMDAECAQLLNRAQALYGSPIGEGRNRIVFLDGDFVVKIPRTQIGHWANLSELDTLGDIYAISSVDPLSLEFKHYPVLALRMELVIPTSGSKKPNWTWAIDCSQVGWSLDGRLVAYDWDNC